MRAVITGGLGFVGRHLERHLLGLGDEVLTIDRHGDHAVDITDGPAVTQKLAELEPDAVYHLAGWADVGASWKDPVGAFRANAEGTLHVLRACIDASWSGRSRAMVGRMSNKNSSSASGSPG